MNPTWIVRTARLVLRPVTSSDLPDLRAIKADPRVFAVMLGGVRNSVQSAEELAEDIAAWGAYGIGIWSVRTPDDGAFHGLVGVTERPDGRGMGLRYALWPDSQGHGYAKEAAGAALRYAHERAGLARVIAVAREDNFASRMVLGGIGMVECASFTRQGYRLIIYESVVRPD